MPLRKLAAELGRAAAMQKRAVGAADLAGSALGRKVLAEAGVIPANLVGAGLPADVMGGLYGKTWDVAAKLPGSSALRQWLAAPMREYQAALSAKVAPKLPPRIGAFPGALKQRAARSIAGKGSLLRRLGSGIMRLPTWGKALGVAGLAAGAGYGLSRLLHRQQPPAQAQAAQWFPYGGAQWS